MSQCCKQCHGPCRATTAPFHSSRHVLDTDCQPVSHTRAGQLDIQGQCKHLCHLRAAKPHQSLHACRLRRARIASGKLSVSSLSFLLLLLAIWCPFPSPLSLSVSCSALPFKCIGGALQICRRSMLIYRMLVTSAQSKGSHSLCVLCVHVFYPAAWLGQDKRASLLTGNPRKRL